MSELDFRKQLLLNELKDMSKGLSNEELFPLLLAVNDKAKRAGITFTTEDCLMVFNSIRSDMTEKELQLASELLKIAGK